MNHRTRQATLILLVLSILLSALIPAVGAADPTRRHTLDEALLLMVSGELWATGGGGPVEVSVGGPGLLSLAAGPRASARQTQIAINAVKEVIALKESVYAESHAMLEGHVSPETVQAHEDAYVQEMKQLNATLENLRREWRRQKRFWPKLTKPFKQAGAWFWHQIGPAGRQVLRLVGDDLVQLVIAGDPVTGKVVRMLIVKHAKAAGREKAKVWLSRLILGREPDEAEPAGAEEEPITADAAWATIKAQLEEQRRNCQTGAIQQLENCVRQTIAGAADLADILLACDYYLSQISENDPGGTVHLRKEMGEDTPAGPGEILRYELTYPSAGGAVTGSYYRHLDLSVAGCRVTQRVSFEGTYTVGDCAMSGTAAVTYQVAPLVPIEGWGVKERDHCFMTGNISRGPDLIEVPTPWRATLENGTLDIDVGEEGCTDPRSCPGLIWFDVWQDSTPAGEGDGN
jgi:hypothetical protein